MINQEELNKTLYLYGTCLEKSAFMDGLHWFERTLWHDANEEPELNKKLVVQCTNYMGDIDYEVDTNHSLISWKDWVISYRISKWCYIEDILPKGGGK